jgi:hypothetical protein
MHTFTVTTSRQIQAETAEEAALLMYQTLTRAAAPINYAVTDEANLTTYVELDRDSAVNFASTDHTADPGNW